MILPRKRGKVKKKAAVSKRSKKPRSKKSLSVNTKKKKKRVRKRPLVSKHKPKRRQKGSRPESNRSKAARKGWETRRSNQLRKEAQTSVDAHLAFLRQPAVSAQITDQLIRTGLIRTGMIQSVETQMLSRLIVAEQLGNFEETASDLAVEFNWDIRDVYTLWHSP